MNIQRAHTDYGFLFRFNDRIEILINNDGEIIVSPDMSRNRILKPFAQWTYADLPDVLRLLIVTLRSDKLRSSADFTLEDAKLRDKKIRAVKSVAYAYPTSPLAKDYGYQDKGCWIVKAPGFETKHFETKERESAFVYAESIPMDYEPYSFLPKDDFSDMGGM